MLGHSRSVADTAKTVGAYASRAQGSWNNGPEGRRHGMAHLAISLLARVEPGPARRSDRHGYGVNHCRCCRPIQPAYFL